MAWTFWAIASWVGVLARRIAILFGFEPSMLTLYKWSWFASRGCMHICSTTQYGPWRWSIIHDTNRIVYTHCVVVCVQSSLQLCYLLQKVSWGLHDGRLSLSWGKLLATSVVLMWSTDRLSTSWLWWCSPWAPHSCRWNRSPRCHLLLLQWPM